MYVFIDVALEINFSTTKIYYHINKFMNLKLLILLFFSLPIHLINYAIGSVTELQYSSNRFPLAIYDMPIALYLLPGI